MNKKTTYIAPTSLDEALKILNNNMGETKVIAGGTDLIPRMRSGMATPKRLLDIRKLSLSSIKLQGDFICIGAGATHTAIMESELLSVYCPILRKVAYKIAGPPIRNRGTVGGNLVSASPAADLAPPLLINDAEVVLSSFRAERVVPLVDFFTGPGETVITHKEILTEIRIPVSTETAATCFIKLGKRNAMTISVVHSAVRFSLDSKGKIASSRIALGSVAPTPVRAVKAEEALEGELPGMELFQNVSALASEEVSPISDNRASAGYRLEMVYVLTKRSLLTAFSDYKKVI